MKSNRSFFNRALFGSALKRFWPFWLMYFIVLCAVVPAQLTGWSPEWLRTVANGLLIETRWDVLVLVAAVMGAVTAMCVFGTAFFRRQNDLICSLPVSRGAVFISCFTAGLAALAAADLAVVLVCAAAEAVQGVLNVRILLLLLAFLLLLDLTFYGFAALCAMLTGSVIVLPLVYLVLEVTAFAVGVLVDCILGSLVFGYDNGIAAGFSSRLSPIVWLLELTGYDMANSGAVALMLRHHLSSLGIYAAAGLACATVGLLLYRRRAMENAGEVVAVPVLRPVFRWCMALGCGLIATALFCAIRGGGAFCGTASTAAGSVICAAAGAVIGWLAAEMMIKRTLRVPIRRISGACIPAAVLAAGVLCAGTGLFGYETRIPDPEDVQSVIVSITWPSLSDEDAGTVLLLEEAHRALIDSRGDYASAGAQSYHRSTRSGMIIYMLRDGRRLERYYTLYDPADYPSMREDTDNFEKVLNTDAGFRAKKLSFPDEEDLLLQVSVSAYTELETGDVWWTTLTDDQAMALYQAVERDLDAHAIGETVLFPEETAPEAEQIQLYFDLFRRESDPERGEYFVDIDHTYFTVTETALNTTAWLRENIRDADL